VRDPAHREQKVGCRRDNFAAHPILLPYVEKGNPSGLTWNSYQEMLLVPVFGLPLSEVSKFLPLITLRNTWRDPAHACLNISLDGKLFYEEEIGLLVPSEVEG